MQFPRVIVIEIESVYYFFSLFQRNEAATHPPQPPPRLHCLPLPPPPLVPDEYTRSSRAAVCTACRTIPTAAESCVGSRTQGETRHHSHHSRAAFPHACIWNIYQSCGPLLNQSHHCHPLVSAIRQEFPQRGLLAPLFHEPCGMARAACLSL